jgi:hypothetical protein
MNHVQFTSAYHAMAVRLTGIYLRALLWYLLAVLVLWAVGVEAIYGHPTPFYALYFPAFESAAIPAATALAGLAGYALIFRWRMQRWPGSAAIPVAILGLAIALGAILYQKSAGPDQSVAVAWTAFWGDFRWHALAVSVFCSGLAALLWHMRGDEWLRAELTGRERIWWLLGLCSFYVAFACAIAMLRNGPEGIAQAYSRQAYEYIGDIGKTRSIRDLFARYEEIHPYLSMHAKVHPPGPIALLWFMSFFVTQAPMALSIATIVFGALALIPLYHWANDLAGDGVARTACLLYSLSPSIVIFTATSADILFAPFTITTLFLFDRALARNSWKYALGAGIGFGLMSLMKFSLVAIGAYFAFVGLWTLRDRARLTMVVKTAAVMVAGLAAVHLAVYWWSGFDVVATFQTAKAQFDLDQAHLDELSPRFPSWAWRMLNPLAWFFFAGIPVSVLFLWRLLRKDETLQARWLIFFATLVVLDLLYLARGEGERSALYIIPFLVLPAAHLLQELATANRSFAPIAATLGFLAFQCWLIESYFYTYW